MTTQGSVQAVNINELKRYAAEARVNQPLLSSADLVTRGAVTFEELDPVPLAPGSLVSLPAGLAHRIEAAPDSRMVVIYTTNAGYTSIRPQSSDRSVRLPGENSG
jgi:hypothetical protein